MAETKQLQPIDDIRRNIQLLEPQFKMVLPPHITPERFIRITMTAIQGEPRLVNKATRQSLYAACMQAAQDGLLPDKREGVINVYGDQAKWMPMVGGICKKARNSGEISSIDAQVVYEKDEYDSWIDERGQHFKHVKSRDADRTAGEVRLTYAYAITKDGGFYFEEVDEKQMAAIEGYSKAGNDSPWKGPFRDEMRRKSALRRLAKYRLPSSTDLEEVLHRDDDLYNVPGKGDAAAPAEQAGPSRLKNIVKSKETPAPAAPAAAEAQPKAAEGAQEGASAGSENVPI